jgi:hypothetical protein
MQVSHRRRRHAVRRGRNSSRSLSRHDQALVLLQPHRQIRRGESRHRTAAAHGSNTSAATIDGTVCDKPFHGAARDVNHFPTFGKVAGVATIFFPLGSITVTFEATATINRNQTPRPPSSTSPAPSAT